MSKSVKKHFVNFYSPGTFFAEVTTKEIDDWDIDKAQAMAEEITERYNAKPYAFDFITRTRGPDDLDSHVSSRSGMHYIGCKIMTLEQLVDQNDPEDQTLISNMECNGWNRIVTTKSGWKWTQPLRDGDVVL